MIIRAKDIRMNVTPQGQAEITLTTDDRRVDISKLRAATAKGKQLTAEIKQTRKKRSLDANAMLWAILGEMAVVLRADKDELYLIMLERYGVFTHIVVKPNLIERIKSEWRTVRELGEVTVNGKTGIQLQCFFGSSRYNSMEFSVLLDGVISEAKELGIDLFSEDDKLSALSKLDK